MEIDINQKKITIGDKYQIFIDGQQTHHASSQLLKMLTEIILFENDRDTAIMTINKRLFLFSPKYDITRWNDQLLQFRTISYWKLHYQCLYGDNNYEIFGHRRRKYSIYKNGIQIAWWDKEAVTWFAGDNYKIIADSDCDVDLIISFCLIVDNFSNNDHAGGSFTYSFGNIFFQAKKFDKTWLPR